MFNSEARKIYRSLSPAEKQFLQDKKISSSLRAKDWISLFYKISRYDHANDELRKRLLYFIIGFSIAGFASLFIYPWASLFFAAILGLVIYRKIKLSKQDLSNHLRLFLMPWLKVMEDKAGEKAKIKLELDFRPPKQHGKINETKVNNRTIHHYRPEYIKAEAELKDESLMYLFLIDDFNVLNIKKRTARGKTKYKTKYKLVHHLMLKLVLSTRKYALQPTIPEGISVDRTEEHLVLKYHHKLKSNEEQAVYPFPEFLKIAEHVFQAIIPLEPGSGIVTAEVKPETEGEISSENMAIGAGAIGLAAAPFLVWSGGYFDDYDYDSFSAPGHVSFQDLDSDSVFDS
jgi:hypothetical protein